MSRARRTGWIGIAILMVLLIELLAGRRVGPAGGLEVEGLEVEGLEVEYAGCEHVELGEPIRCVFDPEAPIRLWLEHHDPSALSVRIDGDLWPVDEYTVNGMDGFGLSVVIPADAQELSIDSVEPRARWSLVMSAASSTRSPTLAPTSDDVDMSLIEVYMDALSGNHVDAMARLDEVRTMAFMYPKGRADFAVYRGIALWTQGRLHDAATSFRDGVTFAWKLRDRDLIRDALPVYAGILAELGYWDAADDWAEETLTWVRADAQRGDSGPRSELLRCHYEGKVFSTLGYTHLLLARHHGDSPVQASALLREALDRVGPWGSCPDPDSVPGIVLSLASAQLQRDDPAAALSTLSGWGPLRAPTADEQLRIEDVDLQARTRLDRPMVELEQSLQRLEDAVADARLPEGDWRWAVHRGDLLRRQGRLDEALAAYREAETVSQRLAEQAAVGVARTSAVASHARSTEQLARLLVELGRSHDALCVMREARARRIQAVGRRAPNEVQSSELTRAIEDHQAARRAHEQARRSSRRLPQGERKTLEVALEREEERLSRVVAEILKDRSTWRPACEDLVPRQPDELLLGLYPGEGGWLVFAEDGTGTQAEWLEGGPRHATDDPALGNELLGPFSDKLAAASRVRVLATGRAQEVDVHLLRWGGGRLVESLSVVYGAELPRLDPAEGPSEPLALLVTDPTETLHMAPQEVHTAAEWMQAQGWTIYALAPEDADLPRIVDGLERASLFYFAGHGEQDARQTRLRALPPYAGGTRDWSGRLLLKPPTELRVQDVLMLSSAPRHVALLGCETGVPTGRSGGMSLALAFLVAGAHEVVAAPTETEDSVGMTTGLGLLGGMSGTQVSLAEGLRAAQAQMLQRQQKVGRYRVLVR